MYTIKVVDKDSGIIRWTEQHATKERVNEELEHMKNNHFNPIFFNFEVTGGENHD